VNNVIRTKRTLVGAHGLDGTACGEEPVAGSGCERNETLRLVTGSKTLTRLRKDTFPKTILFHGVREMRDFDTA
jgi:hypothetical protein